jgi:signal transduction histidine kinase
MTIPVWMRSVRFRLTLLYTGVLFALAALLIAALYTGLSLSLRDEPVSRAERIRLGQTTFVDARAFEARVNEHTLESLRIFAFGGLGFLFVASLGVGWVIAGRVLSPIARITSVANEIQAGSLARRIELEGPDDELRRLAETFDRMLDRLEAAFIAQRQFVADASHELRTPLAIIQSNLEVALADMDGSPEGRRQAKAAIARTIDRMTKLTDDLLALARLEQSERTVEPVDLAALVREGAEEFEPAAQARGIELERPAASVLVVQGERDLLKRALSNLLDNAVRLAPAGSAVSLEAGRREGWAWFSVADHGPGIPMGERDRVFDRFWRADDARTRANGAGSGLGLAIVRQIAERHRGEARVFERRGGGSTFVVWLPLDPHASVPPGLDPTGAQREGAALVAVARRRPRR